MKKPECKKIMKNDIMMSDVMIKRENALNFALKNIAQKQKFIERNQKTRQKF